jgi:predicted transcriptional regulator
MVVQTTFVGGVSPFKPREVSKVILLVPKQASPRLPDRVMEYVSKRPGCTAPEIVQALGAQSAGVARSLQKLLMDGLVSRSKTRVGKGCPFVYYLPIGDETVTTEQAEQILALRLRGRTWDALERKYRVSRHTMYYAIRGADSVQ